MEESSVESKSASINTSPTTEANSMDIDCVETYLILLESWEGTEHYPVNRIEVGCLVLEGSGIESKGAREVFIEYLSHRDVPYTIV